ncbi:hypothetical protein PR048_024807 [Dryococelus australis]|uniref:Uncharacterized protein n=1 Tax=Dryococelus australis TaxID=614101 RepID=A0ABQ9GPN5_9NEOP|nr:hypothetical protein PR048_024807 [Dryococelus australis]
MDWYDTRRAGNIRKRVGAECRREERPCVVGSRPVATVSVRGFAKYKRTCLMRCPFAVMHPSAPACDGVSHSSKHTWYVVDVLTSMDDALLHCRDIIDGSGVLQGLQVHTEEIWAALNSEDLRADACNGARVWSSAGMKGRGKREIHEEKLAEPMASSGTIPTCENPVTRPEIESWWEVSVLTARPPRIQSLPFSDFGALVVSLAAPRSLRGSFSNISSDFRPPSDSINRKKTAPAWFRLINVKVFITETQLSVAMAVAVAMAWRRLAILEQAGGGGGSEGDRGTRPTEMKEMKGSAEIFLFTGCLAEQHDNRSCVYYTGNSDSPSVYMVLSLPRTSTHKYAFLENPETVSVWCCNTCCTETAGDRVGHGGIQTLDVLLRKLLPQLAQLTLQIRCSCRPIWSQTLLMGERYGTLLAKKARGRPAIPMLHEDGHCPVRKWSCQAAQEGERKWSQNFLDVSPRQQVSFKHHRNERTPRTMTPVFGAPCRSTMKRGSRHWAGRLQTRIRRSHALGGAQVIMGHAVRDAETTDPSDSRLDIVLVETGVFPAAVMCHWMVRSDTRNTEKSQRRPSLIACMTTDVARDTDTLPSNSLWSSTEMKRRGKRVIPEKARQSAASYGMVPTHKKSGATPLGIEADSPWWEARSNER